MIVIEIILCSYFTFAVFYTLLFAIAGNFKISNHVEIEFKENKIAVLIPAYKEDEVILSTAHYALQQDYPSANFNIIIIADSLKTSTIHELAQLPVNVIRVSFENSTKVKSLNAALAEIGDNYDIAVVLDADNVMEEDFLSKINIAFNAGHFIVQGRRVAKNMNTSFAVLDAISEVINNHIYRKGHSVMGLSASLIGSGMAFNYRLFKSTLKKIDAIGGFDRALQLSLIRRGLKIFYLDNAIVYDEKVEHSSTFSNQRKRWLSSQFVYLRKYFYTGPDHLLKGNFDFFNMAILNNILLPRLLLLGMITVLTGGAILWRNYLNIPFFYWILLFDLYVLTFILSIPLKLYNKKLMKALLKLPQAFFILLISLFRLKGVNSQFIHTPHSNIGVDKSLTNSAHCMKPLFSLVTVNYNQTQLTLELLASLKKLTYPDIEVIVVDNDSQESPKQAIKENYPDTIIIESKKNLGFAGGNNLGIAVASGDYLFFVNNDIDITEDAVERILEIFQNYSDAGAVSPKFHYYHHPDTIEYAGYNPVNPYTARNTPVGGYEIDKGQYQEITVTHYAHGGGMCVPRYVIDKVGKMPEEYFLYYEEFDWCEQIKKAGFKIYYQPKATIYHKASSTIGRSSILRTYYLTRNRILFMRRNIPYHKFLIFIVYFTFCALPKNMFFFVKNREFPHIKAYLKAILWNMGFKRTQKV